MDTITPYINRNRVTIAAFVCISSILTAWYLATSQDQKHEPFEISNTGQSLHRSNAVHRRRRRSRTITAANPQNIPEETEGQIDGAYERLSANLDDLDGGETVEDGIGDNPFLGEGHPEHQDHSNNFMSLLYHISEDTARSQAYVHRGVECNGCGICPIQGIRYHCANCYDFDLCENCEANQIHTKTHIFYKIRIPAPVRGHIKNVAPVLYPGKPGVLHPNLSEGMMKSITESTGWERGEVHALYEQFRCLAGHQWLQDPSRLYMAIDRQGFDKYFMPPDSPAASPSRLIYDRIFAYYDENNDGLIGFDEFIKGLKGAEDKTRASRLRRIFNGYDMDGDGYVDRKDFLRMFRAYYALTKEITREILIHQEEDLIEESGGARVFIESAAPLSTAFTGSNIESHASRLGRGKELDINGDLVIDDNAGVLQPDMPPHGNRNTVIVSGAMREHWSNTPETPKDDCLDSNLFIYNSITPSDLADQFLRSGTPPDSREDEDFAFHSREWPPHQPDLKAEDITAGLGTWVPVEDILDPVDRARIVTAYYVRLRSERAKKDKEIEETALNERWKRREFYLDVEEGMTAPPGYTEGDSSEDDDLPRSVLKEPSSALDDTAAGRRPSLRSRSSSKVRFEDDYDDTDHETRSNTSSRSIPVNERWGGFEIREAEKEVGKEILYQAVSQGFNSMLNHFFIDAENLGMQVIETRALRTRWRAMIEDFKLKRDTDAKEHQNKLEQADMEHTNQLLEENGALVAPSAEGKLNTKPEDVPIATNTAVEPTQQSTEDNSVQETSPRILPDRPPSALETSFQVLDRTKSSDSLNSSPSSTTHTDPDTTVPLKTTSQCDPVTTPLPTEKDLARWAWHDAVEQHAKTRGGMGTLNFEEFEQKMVDSDEDADEIMGDEETDPVTGQKVRVRKGWWKNASLGRLGFVGGWLEMGSF